MTTSAIALTRRILLYRRIDAESTFLYLLTVTKPDYQWKRVIKAIRLLVSSSVQGLLTKDATHAAGPNMTQQHASNSLLIPENQLVFEWCRYPTCWSRCYTC